MEQADSRPITISASPTLSSDASLRDRSIHESYPSDNDCKLFSSPHQSCNLNHMNDDEENEDCKSDQDIVMKSPTQCPKKDSYCTEGATRVRQSSREVGERITLDVLEKYYNMPLTWAAKELKVSNTMLKKLCRKYGIQRWPHRQIRSIENDLEKQKNIRDSAVSPSDRAAAEDMIKKLEEKKSIVTKTASCGFSASLRSMIFMARPGELDAKHLILSGMIPAMQNKNVEANRFGGFDSIAPNMFNLANPFLNQHSNVVKPELKFYPTNGANSNSIRQEISFFPDNRGNPILQSNSAPFGGFDPMNLTQNRYAPIQPNISQQNQLQYQVPYNSQAAWIPFQSNNDGTKNFGSANLNVDPQKNDQMSLLQSIQRQQVLLNQLGYGNNGCGVNRSSIQSNGNGQMPAMQPNFQSSNHNLFNQINGVFSNRQKSELLAQHD